MRRKSRIGKGFLMEHLIIGRIWRWSNNLATAHLIAAAVMMMKMFSSMIMKQV
jgi:hypothetical protein